MTFEAPTQSSKGRIREVVLGGGNGAVTVGGQNALAFHDFDGEIPHAPIIAMGDTSKTTDMSQSGVFRTSKERSIP